MCTKILFLADSSIFKKHKFCNRLSEKFIFSKLFSRFIVNKLSWCGTENDPGINFDKCPWECSIQSNYWAVANKKVFGFTLLFQGFRFFTMFEEFTLFHVHLTYHRQ